MKATRCIVIFAIVTFLATGTTLCAQKVGTAENEYDWQLSVIGGFLDFGELAEFYLDTGEEVNVRLDDPWMVGLRFGVEDEFLGIELTAATAFADVNLSADPIAMADLPSGNDAVMFIGNIDALWFPVGNALSDGRVRPFVAVGPGLLHLDSDVGPIDNETMFDINMGFGVKILCGDNGNPILRLDYRWHRMLGEGNINDAVSFQEITAGIGFRF